MFWSWTRWHKHNTLELVLDRTIGSLELDAINTTLLNLIERWCHLFLPFRKYRWTWVIKTIFAPRPFERLLMATIPVYNLVCFIGPLYCPPSRHDDDDDDRAGFVHLEEQTDELMVPTYLPINY